MSFIPDNPKNSVSVPFFEDVTSDGGWQGHSTKKTINRLQLEVTEAITRLGGFVTAFVPGTFLINEQKRGGYQLHYTINTPNNAFVPGRLDIAALPIRDNYRYRSSQSSRREKSLKMALYMLKISLDGAWFLQQLSPGYAPLMPWMLADGQRTVTELWSDSPIMSQLLPPGKSEFVNEDAKNEH